MRMQASVAVWLTLAGVSTAAGPVRNALGYPGDGEIHARQSVPVRAIVSSIDNPKGLRDGAEEHELVYQVCNVDQGDSKAKRPPGRLYFQWPAAGFRTSALGELPVETCLVFVRRLTARTRPESKDILYTKDPKALPATTYTMESQPPWSKPEHYWNYMSQLVSGKLMLGMKEAQTEFQISAVRKSPKDPIYYQHMNWRKGTQLYMVLPRTQPQVVAALRSSLSRLEAQGYLFSIRSGPEAARDFESADDAWVAADFGQRDVLRLERTDAWEKEATSSVNLELPVTGLDIVELPAVQRDRTAGRATYMGVYVAAGT